MSRLPGLHPGVRVPPSQPEEMFTGHLKNLHGCKNFLQSILFYMEKLTGVKMIKLPREFYDRKTITVARDLLGKSLVHISTNTARIGRIVEVEAYMGEHDLASHTSQKRKQNAARVMFGRAGCAYIYQIHQSMCLNVVTEGEGIGAAVLIRALEPIQNLDKPTHGPGRLCKAMNIDRRLNGHDLSSDVLFIAETSNDTPFKIINRPRVNIPYAREWKNKLLRFYIDGNRFISKK
jgi:DNA-3-methyladenine glycosylase